MEDEKKNNRFWRFVLIASSLILASVSTVRVFFYKTLSNVTKTNSTNNTKIVFGSAIFLVIAASVGAINYDPNWMYLNGTGDAQTLFINETYARNIFVEKNNTLFLNNKITLSLDNVTGSRQQIDSLNQSIQSINSTSNIKSLYENNSLIPCSNITGATSNLCTIAPILNTTFNVTTIFNTTFNVTQNNSINTTFNITTVFNTTFNVTQNNTINTTFNVTTVFNTTFNVTQNNTIADGNFNQTMNETIANLTTTVNNNNNTINASLATKQNTGENLTRLSLINITGGGQNSCPSGQFLSNVSFGNNVSIVCATPIATILENSTRLSTFNVSGIQGFNTTADNVTINFTLGALQANNLTINTTLGIFSANNLTLNASIGICLANNLTINSTLGELRANNITINASLAGKLNTGQNQTVLSIFNITRLISSFQCSATQFLSNATINESGIFGNCAVPTAVVSENSTKLTEDNVTGLNTNLSYEPKDNATQAVELGNLRSNVSEFVANNKTIFSWVNINLTEFMNNNKTIFNWVNTNLTQESKDNVTQATAIDTKATGQIAFTNFSRLTANVTATSGDRYSAIFFMNLTNGKDVDIYCLLNIETNETRTGMRLNVITSGTSFVTQNAVTYMGGVGKLMVNSTICNIENNSLDCTTPSSAGAGVNIPIEIMSSTTQSSAGNLNVSIKPTVNQTRITVKRGSKCTTIEQ